jgi:tRNA G18 (ribose-2'-O)-methylase SpoU
MNPIRVTLADPRLEPFREMKDRDLRRRDGRFIAEGELVVRRLLASRYACDAVLCSPRLADELMAVVPVGVPLLVLADREIDQVIGFRFHNGCLAVGRAPPMPGIDAWCAPNTGPTTLLALHELNNTENLGSICRIAAGFGVSGVLLGPRNADPFYRQCVRVSMGNVLSLDLASSDDLASDLRRLSTAGYDVVATVTHADATPIHRWTPAERTVIVLGSEAHGLDQATVSACNSRVTIPMHLGTDSLNVSIATAIFLYHQSIRRGAD